VSACPCSPAWFFLYMCTLLVCFRLQVKANEWMNEWMKQQKTRSQRQAGRRMRPTCYAHIHCTSAQTDRQAENNAAAAPNPALEFAAMHGRGCWKLLGKDALFGAAGMNGLNVSDERTEFRREFQIVGAGAAWKQREPKVRSVRGTRMIG